MEDELGSWTMGPATWSDSQYCSESQVLPPSTLWRKASLPPSLVSRQSTTTWPLPQASIHSRSEPVLLERSTGLVQVTPLSVEAWKGMGPLLPLRPAQ